MNFHVVFGKGWALKRKIHGRRLTINAYHQLVKLNLKPVRQKKNGSNRTFVTNIIKGKLVAFYGLARYYDTLPSSTTLCRIKWSSLNQMNGLEPAGKNLIISKWINTLQFWHRWGRKCVFCIHYRWHDNNQKAFQRQILLPLWSKNL